MNNTPDVKTWEERFDEDFLFPNKQPPIVDLQGNEYLHRVDYKKFKSFIAQVESEAEKAGFGKGYKTGRDNMANHIAKILNDPTMTKERAFKVILDYLL